jgi:hypothetical protein
LKDALEKTLLGERLFEEEKSKIFLLQKDVRPEKYFVASFERSEKQPI